MAATPNAHGLSGSGRQIRMAARGIVIASRRGQLTGLESEMHKPTITRPDLLQGRQGSAVADVPMTDFSICEGRQRVVQEPESQSSIDDFLSSNHPQITKRLRQAWALRPERAWNVMVGRRLAREALSGCSSAGVRT